MVRFMWLMVYAVSFTVASMFLPDIKNLVVVCASIIMIELYDIKEKLK